MAPSCKIFPELLPQRVRQEPKLSAEVRVYDLLRAQIGFGWTVFYDVAWLGLANPKNGPRDGQIDFVVAHPAKGLLLIEVKGGRIRFEGPTRQWISTDRHGVEHEIEPFAQVRTSKYALLNKLKSLPSLRNKWIQLSHAVCFPASARPKHAVTPDAPPEIIIGADDLDRLAPRVEEILSFSHGESDSTFEHGDLIVSELTKLLARTIELPNSLAVQAVAEHQEMIRLTESQMHILSLLRRIRRAAIGGAAGSGKTFLAVEKAKRLATEGFKTLLTCYTEPLAEFLTTLTESHDNLDVLTVHELSKQLSTPPAQDVPDANSLFDAMTGRDERPYDAIVVDEGQDLSADWWLALESCLREGKESVFYVFHDTHQTLYQHGGVLPDGMTEYALEDNVRNTQAICELLCNHYCGDVAITPRGPAGRKIEKVPYADEKQLAQSLSKLINRLLDTERIGNGDIIILTPRRADRSALTTMKLSGSLALVSGPPAPRTRQVQFASIEQFKGLERKVAVVTELDGALTDDEALRSALCYVAFSRPRHHLVLMGHREILATVFGGSPQ